MTNQDILELVEQNRLKTETAIELLKAPDLVTTVVTMVADRRLNAVIGAFLLEEDTAHAGELLLRVIETKTAAKPTRANAKRR
jgi:hypothetical protein